MTRGMIMLYRYGTFVARRARLLLVLAGIGMLIALVLGLGAFGKLKSGGFDDPAAASTRAQTLIDTRYGGDSNLALLVTAHSGVNDPAVKAAASTLTAKLSADPGVSDVVSYWSTGAAALKSTDGTQGLVLAHISGTDDQVIDRAKTIVPQVQGDHGAITVAAGGLAGANVDVNNQVTHSLAIAEAVAIPVTLILLILAFGAVVAALLPLAIGGLAILGTCPSSRST
jgi:RND superfamily putative drug exporter